MIKDISTTETPLRSRLFNLPMRGECGATQESLLSYAHRLSAEHHLPVRLMMTEVLMPASGLDTLLTSVGKVKTVDPRALHSVNGAAAGAAKFANGLAGLTSRRDLANGTFLHWANLLSHRVPMAASRRWCPHCIADQRGHQFVAFGLLWTPKVAQACPIHRVLLEDRCAQCQALQPILGDEPTRGLCWKCHACLGSVQQCQKTRPAGERDQFIAEAIAEMIEMPTESPGNRGSAAAESAVSQDCRGAVRTVGIQAGAPPEDVRAHARTWSTPDRFRLCRSCLSPWAEAKRATPGQ